jgi:hypothetical protein
MRVHAGEGEVAEAEGKEKRHRDLEIALQLEGRDEDAEGDEDGEFSRPVDGGNGNPATSLLGCVLAKVCYGSD